MRNIFFCFVLIKLLALSYCFSFAQELKKESNLYKIYVVKYDWHTGVIFERNAAVKFFPALQDDYNDFKFIEIGWGDKDFYMAEKETFWITFKAGMLPTKSVLHVTALMNNPEKHYKGLEMVIINLRKDDFKNLIQYFNKSFALDTNKNNIKLKDGLKENSLFYLSKEKYHIFKTCNAWIARGLKRAGVPVHPFYALTSKNIMKQLKKVDEYERY
ncbi:MAG: DUF2459 domain-containing protein [Bacteroidota bacterium]|nr:DUF2459 domain-containing protein [Bacteroidota bacterium]